jgi:arylsulfatase A-like enzyme/Tfp pilus assembly protein PilF
MRWGRDGVGALLFLAAGILSACRPARQQSGSSQPRSLLLVTIDTVRADHLGAYGDTRAETPWLDRIGREGLRFNQAESAVPLTLPSHATILSGLLPPHHGLRNNGAGAFPADRATIATCLSAAGYRTGAFVGAFVLDHRYGLSRGFEIYDDEIVRDPAAPQGLEAERPGSEVVDRALAWLNHDDPRPFFAWVHLYDAHAPYTPPEPFLSRHRDSPYDGEIASVDFQVGRLLQWIDAGGLSKTTIVAVAADHGEALGEHGELTHGLLLYEPTLRVPLLIRAPDTIAPGSVFRTPVSLADLAPTLAGLLSRKLSPGEPMDGRDLSEALKTGKAPAPEDLYAETEYPRLLGWSGLSALRQGSLKFIEAPTPELYDLSRDPAESKNLLKADTARPDLVARISRFQRESRIAPEPPGPSAEAAAKLASLGYVSGSPSSRPGDTNDKNLRDPKEMVWAFREFERATWALNEGHLQEAADALAKLVAADPANAVFRGSLAKAYRQKGDLPRAIALYRKAVQDSPQDAEARYNLAVALQEAGRNAEALGEIQEALRHNTTNSDAHNVLGIACFDSGRPEEALAEFETAARMDPLDARAQNNRGNVLRQLRRYDDAEAAYRKAIALAPRYADPWNGLGALEVQRDRPAEALPCFDRALALAPRSYEALLNRGIARDMLGDERSAVADYRRFLSSVGADPVFAPQRQAAQQLIARAERR